MLELIEIIILSADEIGDSLSIEGKAVFDGDLATPFTAVYYPEDDELDILTLENNPGRFDKRRFKELLLAAVTEFDAE